MALGDNDHTAKIMAYSMAKMSLFLWPLPVVIVALVIGSCGYQKAGTSILEHNTQEDSLRYLDRYRPPVLRDGQVITFSALTNLAKEQRVVFVGERHDRYDHHLNQLALLQNLHQSHVNLSIGVEWFQKPFQGVIDQYLAGDIDETTFLTQTGYFDRWGYDYRMLRPIVEFARKNDIPLIALNADADLTRKISAVGLDGLSTKERASLPKVISPMPADEVTGLRSTFEQHPAATEEKFERFVLVQRVWDLTMAEVIVTHLEEHPEKLMIVFTGDGHASKNRAIPRIISEERPSWKTIVVQSGKEPVDELGAADFMIDSQPRHLNPTGKLGVLLNNSGNGVEIKSVMQKSPASEAGLMEGDLVTHINEFETPTIAALRLALSEHAPKDRVTVQFQRNTRSEKVEVTLQ